ncbi:hypothetical protein DEO72_LG3g2266 [Vigna unguiculata]|uniref:GRF-type domain-containing protein n=1 Tax=Vigna unguiculata TaxID=3917 RepID=A0A4D6LH71_VIGUN|nr:hypothetical protein DEO72_LG3g2266 [Vigna unguiculata]
MKSGSKGFPCMPQNTGSKMSQSCASSSEMSSKVYGCGERLLLLKASTVKNKGKLFWRCRNWATNSHCNYFEWVDDEEFDFQRKETESEAIGGKRVDAVVASELSCTCTTRAPLFAQYSAASSEDKTLVSYGFQALLLRIQSSTHSYGVVSKLDDDVVATFCNSFRARRNCDSITRQYRSLHLNDSRIGLLPLAATRPNSTFQPTTRSYAITINLLLRANLLIHARALLRFLTKTNTHSHAVPALVDSFLNVVVSTSRDLAVNLLIQAYAKAKLMDVAFHVCRYMEEYGVCVTVVSFNALLHAVQRSEKCFLVWEVYEFMIRRRIYPNLTSLRIMVDALCKEGELQKIVDMLDRIMSRSTFRSPSMIVNSAYIHNKPKSFAWNGKKPNCSLMLRILERGRVAESESDVVVLVKRLLQKNLLHENVVWSLVLHAKVAFGDLDSVWGLYGEMVVERLCEKGEVEKANGMLSVLMDKGFSPDDVTYSLLMQGYARKEEVQEVLKLYYEMEYKRVNPGLSVFVTVVRCLCRCGKVEEAERYLRVMRERLVALDASVYEELIDGYIKKGILLGPFTFGRKWLLWSCNIRRMSSVIEIVKSM